MTILVAYDGSEASKRALDTAAKMAAMFKGELIILAVVPRVTIPIIASTEVSTMDLETQEYQEKMKEVFLGSCLCGSNRHTGATFLRRAIHERKSVTTH